MLSMMWARSADRGGYLPETEKYREQIGKFERIYWEGFDDDPIKPEIERIVGEIEATCRGIIGSKGTLSSLLKVKVAK
jgi:hypothetical protein